MNKNRLVIPLITLVLGCMGHNAETQAVELTEFLYTTRIESDFTPNALNCIPLKKEIVSETNNNFSGLRIFDDLGRETPYVIYGERKPPQVIKAFTFKVISYQDADGLTEIVVERPKSGTTFSSIQFITSNRDFKKSVKIIGSSDRKTWNDIASETIFDFTSRVDLRKTSIKTPEVDYPYLKIYIKDDSSAGERGTDIKLHYNGLEFAVSGDRKKLFRIDSIIGTNGVSAPSEEVLDYTYCDIRDIFTDSEGNTVINLDRVNLPVAELTIKVRNPYYYRFVELLGSVSTEEKSFRKLCSGNIYKITGMKNPEDTIRCIQSSMKYLQLKIFNGDNQQLQISKILVGWVKQNLYFVPESGRSYSLYFGSDKVEMPLYELKNLIAPEYEKLKQCKVIETESITSSPYYKPQESVVNNREKIEKSILTSVVLILVGGLGYWAYKLMKRVPTEMEEK
ncbi:MAG: hypothetical protein GY777_23755 [Candidatus Brocadiaceae bacterium]|nr:hypothetical protein [Candidatus Brocadiaceae bacterium]